MHTKWGHRGIVRSVDGAASSVPTLPGRAGGSLFDEADNGLLDIVICPDNEHGKLLAYIFLLIYSDHHLSIFDTSEVNNCFWCIFEFVVSSF